MANLIDQKQAAINIKTLSDLVFVIMDNDKTFGMDVVEGAVSGAMSTLNLKFKEYFLVLAENEEAYDQTPFDTTEEYFFDRINSMKVKQGLIDLMVKLCVTSY